MLLPRSVPRRPLPHLRLLRGSRPTSAAQQWQRASRRGYASAQETAQNAKEKAKKGLAGDLPWAIGAVVVTVPSTYLILANGSKGEEAGMPGSQYHPPHDEEHEEGEDGGEEGGDEGEDAKAEASNESEEKTEEGEDKAEDDEEKAEGGEKKRDSEKKADGGDAKAEDALKDASSDSGKQDKDSKGREQKEAAEEKTGDKK